MIHKRVREVCAHTSLSSSALPVSCLVEILLVEAPSLLTQLMPWPSEHMGKSGRCFHDLPELGGRSGQAPPDWEASRLLKREACVILSRLLEPEPVGAQRVRGAAPSYSPVCTL